MALLRLTALARFLVVCLLTLRVRDLVLPPLAGIGRTKMWWSVLPIVRVCRFYVGFGQWLYGAGISQPN